MNWKPLFIFGAVVGLGACHSPQQASLSPTSKTFPSALIPRDVITASEAELVLRGFRITHRRDGSLAGVHTASGTGNSNYIRCRNRLGTDEGNPSTSILETEVSVSVFARQDR